MAEQLMNPVDTQSAEATHVQHLPAEVNAQFDEIISQEQARTLTWAERQAEVTPSQRGEVIREAIAAKNNAEVISETQPKRSAVTERLLNGGELGLKNAAKEEAKTLKNRVIEHSDRLAELTAKREKRQETVERNSKAKEHAEQWGAFRKKAWQEHMGVVTKEERAAKVVSNTEQDLAGKKFDPRSPFGRRLEAKQEIAHAEDAQNDAAPAPIADDIYRQPKSVLDIDLKSLESDKTVEQLEEELDQTLRACAKELAINGETELAVSFKKTINAQADELMAAKGMTGSDQINNYRNKMTFRLSYFENAAKAEQKGDTRQQKLMEAKAERLKTEELDKDEQKLLEKLREIPERQRVIARMKYLKNAALLAIPAIPTQIQKGLQWIGEKTSRKENMTDKEKRIRGAAVLLGAAAVGLAGYMVYKNVADGSIIGGQDASMAPDVTGIDSMELPGADGASAAPEASGVQTPTPEVPDFSVVDVPKGGGTSHIANELGINFDSADQWQQFNSQTNPLFEGLDGIYQDKASGEYWVKNPGNFRVPQEIIENMERIAEEIKSKK